MYTYENKCHTQNKENIKVVLFSENREVIDKLSNEDDLSLLLNSLGPVIGIEILIKSIFNTYPEISAFSVSYESNDLDETVFYDNGKLVTYRLVLKNEKSNELIKVEVDNYGLRTNVNREYYHNHLEEVKKQLNDIYNNLDLISDLNYSKDNKLLKTR